MASVRPPEELFFGIVRAIGADVEPVEHLIEGTLRPARFKPTTIRLSALLKSVDTLKHLSTHPVHDRYRTHMDLGDHYRSVTQRQDAVTLLGVNDLVRVRASAAASGNAHRAFYVIRSLVRPEEAATLRQIYGSQFFLIAVSSSQDARLARLAQEIADSTGTQPEQCESIARDLIRRDSGAVVDGTDLEVPLHPAVAPDGKYAAKEGYAVDVGRTFQLADVFVSPADPEKSSRTIQRFLELVLSHPFHTPTIDEMGMYVAYGCALSSASLSRRVGAAIMGDRGEVLAVGANEVPRFGGGVYTSEVLPDWRDHRRGFDPNDRAKRQFLSDVLRRLRESGWLAKRAGAAGNSVELGGKNIEELVDLALHDSRLRKAAFLDILEYGRAVHAEMASLSDAARRGISVDGATLYCTTFCCHECARQIVASGIRRVVYVEAYPKSRVADLFPDTVGLAERVTDIGQRVRFEPFIGIGPRRFVDLFSWVPRRKCDETSQTWNDLQGEVVDWDISTAPVRPSIVNAHDEFLQAQVLASAQAETWAVQAMHIGLTAYRRSTKMKEADHG